MSGIFDDGTGFYDSFSEGVRDGQSKFVGVMRQATNEVFPITTIDSEISPEVLEKIDALGVQFTQELAMSVDQYLAGLLDTLKSNNHKINVGFILDNTFNLMTFVYYPFMKMFVDNQLLTINTLDTLVNTTSVAMNHMFKVMITQNSKNLIGSESQSNTLKLLIAYAKLKETMDKLDPSTKETKDKPFTSDN
jgi:hypothetical protein